MKNKLAIILLGVAILSLVGCNKENKNNEVKEEVQTETSIEKNKKDNDEESMKEETQTETSIETTNNKEYVNNNLVTGINNLGFQLQDKIKSSNNTENTLQSPYSIVLAFSMLDLTADNNTKNQLESVLGITDLDSWNNQIKDLIDSEKEMNELANKYQNSPRLMTSNSLWINENFELAEDAEKNVINNIEDKYNGDIFNVNFKDEKTNAQIDKWIDEKTNSLIKGLNSDIKDLESLLINTIYFKGTWVNPFNEYNTDKRDFRNESGVSKVDTMVLSGESFDFIEKDGLKAISLPYYGDYEMVLIKSTNNKDLTTDKFDNLSIEEKMDFLNELSEAPESAMFKTVQIPKFKYEYDYSNIKKDLISLGITDTFDLYKANLSKLGNGIYIEDVKHKAVISVDENGTEAAAMTALMAKDSAYIIDYTEPEEEFIADKPFTYIIKNSDTGLIYFIGTINSLE